LVIQIEFLSMPASKSTPVALFIFNRPHLTSRLFERVRAARPGRLIVVADGARTSRPGEAELCEATRKIVTSPDWTCELLTNFSPENLGCKRRMSSGLDWVFQHCEEAIILEDDCIPCPSFFAFCSAMLERYRDDSRIMHISGDNFQGGRRRGDGSYFFSRYTHSWGWATWRRAWRHYDVDIPSWPSDRKRHWLESFLENPAEVQYWESIFDRLCRGEIDTWDYQWLFACWQHGGLSILPNVNLITNIGVGPDATHFKDTYSTVGIPTGELTEFIAPAAIARDKEADRFTFEEHIGGKQSPNDAGFLTRIRRSLALRSRLKSILPRSIRNRFRWAARG
jgi:hypothetical protein